MNKRYKKLKSVLFNIYTKVVQQNKTKKATIFNFENRDFLPSTINYLLALNPNEAPILKLSLRGTT